MTTMVQSLLSVGLGEIKTATQPGMVLTALGLGSCIGVAFYDPVARVGGMAHVVLPAPADTAAEASPKFATVAVPALLQQMLTAGAERRRLVCTIAGGAQVLASVAMRDSFRIGERNIQAVLEALHRSASGRAPRTGGTTGRSLGLALPDGRVSVKKLGQDWKDL
ncbi:MAG: chemotaxis protein CheD [Dehalococcoidia bacterium]